MDATLILLILGLFVAVVVLKSVIGLALRFALFVAVAALVLHRQQGVGASDLLDPDRLVTLLLSAAVGLVGTKLIAFALFRDSKLRFVLTPITGILVTAAATQAFQA